MEELKVPGRIILGRTERPHKPTIGAGLSLTQPGKKEEDLGRGRRASRGRESWTGPRGEIRQTSFPSFCGIFLNCGETHYSEPNSRTFSSL